MKILLVAPDKPNLLLVPEVREITATHHTEVLNGEVTVKDIFDACKRSNFRAFHFAGHGSADGLQLSKGEILTPKDIAQLCRMAKIEIVVLNACDTGVPAVYATRHGARYAIYGIQEIQDSFAWQMPLAFYNALRNGHSEDVVGALEIADDGGAIYGWTIAPSFLSSLIEEVRTLTERIRLLETSFAANANDEAFRLSKQNVIKITGIYLTIVAVLVIMIFIAANWGGR